MRTDSGDGLDLYRELQRHDLSNPDVGAALIRARSFVDITARCLAVQGDVEAAAATSHLLLFYLRAILGTVSLSEVWSRSGDSGPSQFYRHDDFLCQLFEWLVGNFSADEALAGCLQVWAGNTDEDRPKLYSAFKKPAPPHPFTMADAPPILDWILHNSSRPVHVLAHYDGHGVTMAALTLRYLTRLGIEADCALSFEWTGDIGKLWKRAVVKAASSENNYSTIVLVDCPIHSRRPEYTLKSLSRAGASKNKRIVIVDHHWDTIMLTPELQDIPHVQVVLTGIPECGLSDHWADHERDLMLTGALCDKMPGLPKSADPSGALQKAADAIHLRCLANSPTPARYKETSTFPLEPLWKALAGGETVLAETVSNVLGEIAEPGTPELPDSVRVGAFAFVVSRLELPGRAWYALLERVMASEGTSYCIALRLLNGRRANILLLTHWEDVHVPPVRSFVPKTYHHRCLGHATAVWADLDKAEADQFLTQVVDRANNFFGVIADATAAIREINKNILEAQPVHDSSHELDGY